MPPRTITLCLPRIRIHSDVRFPSKISSASVSTILRCTRRNFPSATSLFFLPPRGETYCGGCLSECNLHTLYFFPFKMYLHPPSLNIVPKHYHCIYTLMDALPLPLLHLSCIENVGEVVLCLPNPTAATLDRDAPRRPNMECNIPSVMIPCSMPESSSISIDSISHQ